MHSGTNATTATATLIPPALLFVGTLDRVRDIWMTEEFCAEVDGPVAKFGSAR